MVLHGRPASVVTIDGLNGGKRPKELPLLRYIFQGELTVAGFAWPEFQITHTVECLLPNQQENMRRSWTCHIGSGLSL